jgi:hypothetical protein
MKKLLAARRKPMKKQDVTPPSLGVWKKNRILSTVSALPATVKNPQSYFMRTHCNTTYIDPTGTQQTCTSMILLAMPWSHCPNCHHVARLKKMTPPTRCFKCGFNLVKWRLTNGINDPVSSSDFGPQAAETAA